MTNLEFMRISRETQQHADENPMLTEFWREFDHFDIPEGEKLREFTDFISKHCGSLILWRMENTGERFSEWMERRVGEDE